VDTLGGAVLVNLLSMTGYGGAVAACGDAGKMAMTGASVAPFIFRGVTLFGIESVPASRSRWRRPGTGSPRRSIGRCWPR